ncbi:hypothetical protein HPB48_009835 [Haemaphysalis longicornis]|uniref:Secreted protein n=1 Tax=Haemaphysalis longicornis TaxID=44386 RepID=A0A9J6GJR4_HAELO|nr:hypothetical protein HPB48_009835 [Haemaphysalis longicornis]
MAQRFLALEAAVIFLFSLCDEEREGAYIFHLPPDEDGNIADEEHVQENDFSEVVPDDICVCADVMQSSNEDVSPTECSTLGPRWIRPARRQLAVEKVPNHQT